MYNCYTRVNRFEDLVEGQDPFEGRILVTESDDEGWRQAYYVKLEAGDIITPGSKWAAKGKAEMEKEEWLKQIKEEVREQGVDVTKEYTGFQYMLKAI